MFCKKCGKEIKEGAKFCSGCGSKNASIYSSLESKIWFRFSKVFYIILHLISAGIVASVFTVNMPYYSYYSKNYYGSYGEAFFYSLLTLLILVVLIRVIKITFNYIVLGIKPDIKGEFKKWF